VPIAEATVERIGEWMSGLWDATTQPDLAVVATEPGMLTEHHA
jgi:hypothetical protein